jgi:hypothetical protein
MVKTLVVSSNTAEEDRMAAFMIERNALADNRLERVVWYSNLGHSLADMQTEMAFIQGNMDAITKAHTDLCNSHLKIGDRILKLEKSVNTQPKEEPK